MSREEAIEALTSKSVANPDMMLEALDLAIKALSEPTIPLSVIEDIKTELPDHSFWQDAGGEPLVAIRDVVEIIDRKVNEVEHETCD